jgi:hypothetical protein
MNNNLLKQTKTFDFFLLLGSFIYGNLFVIQYSKMNWGFLVIFCVVFFFEFLNKILYFFFERQDPRKIDTESAHIVYICIFTNTLKRGFLLGFFLEAFKVGS